MLTDPAATARVHETTAQRVLEKNVLTATVFPVMDSHVHSEVNALQLVVGIVPLTATVHPVRIVPIVQDMQIAVSAASVLRMVTAPSAVNVLPMATVLIGENVPVTVIVMLHLVENAHATVIVMLLLAAIAHVMETATELHVESVPHMAIVMVPLVGIVLTAQQVTVPHMATVVTGMRVQNAEDSVVAALAEHRVVSVPAEIGVASPLSVTALVVQNVPSVLLTVIVRSAEIVLPMVIVVHGPNVQNVLPTVIVRNEEIVLLTETATEHLEVIVPAIVIVVLVQTVGESVLPMATVDLARNALSVLPTVIAHNVENDPLMVTEVHAQIVGVNVLPMATVQSDHASEIAVDVPTVLVLHAPGVVILVVVMTALLVGKSQNLPKSSAWRANFVWFALTTMIPGLMTMSPVMSWTRLPATN